MSLKAKVKAIVAQAWNPIAERHNSQPKPTPEKQRELLILDAQQAENGLIKFIITINAGAILATLALIGQVKENITKQELASIALGVDYYLNAIIVLGFGLIARMISHWANAAGSLFWYSLLRVVFLGTSIYAFYLFTVGTADVLNALLAAF